MKSLRSLGARLLTDRPGQSLLATAGVALGVALFTGTLVTTTTASRGVDRFIADANGGADVIASAPGGNLSSLADALTASLPGDLVDRVRALPGVTDAVGAFAFPSAFEAGDGRKITQKINRRSVAAVIGTDLRSDRPLMSVHAASGRLPRPGKLEVAVPSRVAKTLGLAVGDDVRVTGAGGVVALRVAAILRAEGVGRLGNVLFTTVDTARGLAGRRDGITQIAVQLRRGERPAAWVRAHAGDVPSGVRLIPAGASLDIYRKQLGALSGALQTAGAGLLLTAGFLIYLTLGMAIAERTRLYGTLQALGATTRQIRRVVLAEALAMGVVGSVVGVGLGVAVARGLSLASARLLDAMFGTAPPLVVPAWTVVTGVVVGLAVSVGSAMVPARRAMRIDPVSAIRDLPLAQPGRSGRWLTALALLTVGASTLVLGGTAVVAAAGIVLVIIGAIALVPVVLAPLARAVGPAVARLSRGVGRVSVLHLVTERVRSAYTLALVMVVMAMTIAIGGVYTSFTKSLAHELDVQLGDTVHLSAAATFPADFVDAVRREPGVAAVAGQGFSTGTLRTRGEESIYVRTIDPATYFDTASFAFVDGGPAAVRAAMARGPAIVLGTATARRLGLARGDLVTIGTPSGPVRFRVAATGAISNIPTVVYTSADAGRRYFGITAPAEILVRPAAGVTPERLRTTLVRDLGGRTTFIADTPAELKADTRAQIGGGINAFFVLLLLAGTVGLFGLANTLAVSVTQRYREIGILRAIGARRRQVQSMAVVESVTLVAAAFVIAVPIGLALSRPLLQTSNAVIGDLVIHYHVPWLMLPLVAVLGLAVALAASYWPARRAAAIEVDAALRFE